jgi:hypothetical protein
MSGQARRIGAVRQACDTSDGPYQAVQLEDGSYALLHGGNAVRRRDVLPFEPRNGMEIIGHYDKRDDLENDWAACMDDIENSDMMLNRQSGATPDEE